MEVRRPRTDDQQLRKVEHVLVPEGCRKVVTWDSYSADIQEP